MGNTDPRGVLVKDEAGRVIAVSGPLDYECHRKQGGVMGDHKLNVALPNEQKAANETKDALLAHIESGTLTKETLMEKLDLLPAGVDNLLERQWDLETAIRVTLLLGRPVNLCLTPEDIP